MIALQNWGHETSEAGTGDKALALCGKEIFDVVVTDLVMEKMDGIQLLRRLKRVSPSSEVLMMSAHGTIEKAVEAMREGAYDFIVKPFSMDHFQMVIQKMLEQAELKKTVRHLRTALADRYAIENIVAESAPMREVMQMVTRIADWGVPVVIQGDSGVGKEMVAMALHQLSSRNARPFVPVNCGAFPETLLDSELFGHTKGAFTGATTNKRGLIEEADGGTLFLDEIGEASQALQVRLLRFLDNGAFRRVGETTERHADVRIVAATNRSIEEEMKGESFREDLYYRLSVGVIRIPPLRERPEDIEALCRRLLETYARRMSKPVPRLHPSVHRRFLTYEWPGNVRELENTIEHAMIVYESDEIRMLDLPCKLQDKSPAETQISLKESLPLREVEKRYILSVLEQTNGNKKKAAEILEISRTTLISRLKQF
jgi:DNA-binding NtrC family response regulator